MPIHKCDCNCHEYRTEYRMVRGTSHEGISVRTIYYDGNDKIVGWDTDPISPLASSVPEVVADLVDGMETLDSMLESTKRPILDEQQLESEYENRIHHD